MALSLFSFRRPHAWVTAAAFLACLLFGGKTRASSSLVVPMELGSGITVEVDQLMAPPPPSGLFPLLVKIHNNSSDAGLWTVSSHNLYGGLVSTDLPIKVPAGQSASVWVYLHMAVPGQAATGGYRQLNVSLQGTKVANGSWSNSFSRTSSGPEKPGAEKHFPGLSNGVLVREADLQKRYRAHGNAELDFVRVNLEIEIPEWRALSGLGQLWMTEGEWTALSPSSRAGVMDWLILGGQMIVLSQDVSTEHAASLKIPPEQAGGVRRMGAGNIKLLRWNGSDLPLDEAMFLLTNHPDDHGGKSPNGYAQGWKLPDIVGAFTVHGWLIFSFILVFGTLVGPVNLFYFAGAQRRHRLFWTTPLISISGGVLLVLLMVFQDGIGGHGARRLLVLMAPEQKRTVLVQEQVSRTGVLLGSVFSISEPVWITPVPLADANVFNGPTSRNQQMVESGELHSGDWFSSRFVQAQVLTAVRPSRGGIEFYPNAGGTPSVVSSLVAPLREVFIVDEEGRVWKAEDLTAGVKKPMNKSGGVALTEWQKSFMDELGPVASDRASRFLTEKGQAFAVSGNADAYAVPTLSSIRWGNQKVIVMGAYEKH